MKWRKPNLFGLMCWSICFIWNLMILINTPGFDKVYILFLNFAVLFYLFIGNYYENRYDEIKD